MKPVVHIDVPGRLAWKAFQSPCSKRWMAVCDELKSTREADSLDELYSGIDEAMHVFLLDLLKGNELEMYLRERGWCARNLADVRDSPDVEFDIPWELVAPRQLSHAS
jgi:hypothetical protein